MSDSPSIATVNTLTTAILLALGSLCGAARPFGEMPHPSEIICKMHAITRILFGSCYDLARVFGTTTNRKRRAAARLLGALLAETDILGHFVVEKILQLTILQKSLPSARTCVGW